MQINGGHLGFHINIRFIQITIFTSSAKEVMFLVALVCMFVCLSVCLSVDNVTQNVMNGLG